MSVGVERLRRLPSLPIAEALVTPHENDRTSISSLWPLLVDSPAMPSSLRNMPSAISGLRRLDVERERGGAVAAAAAWPLHGVVGARGPEVPARAAHDHELGVVEVARADGDEAPVAEVEPVQMGDAAGRRQQRRLERTEAQTVAVDEGALRESRGAPRGCGAGRDAGVDHAPVATVHDPWQLRPAGSRGRLGDGLQAHRPGA